MSIEIILKLSKILELNLNVDVCSAVDNLFLRYNERDVRKNTVHNYDNNDSVKKVTYSDGLSNVFARLKKIFLLSARKDGCLMFL